MAHIRKPTVFIAIESLRAPMAEERWGGLDRPRRTVIRAPKTNREPGAEDEP